MEFKEAGNRAFQNSQWEEAFNLYTKALEIEPKMTAALSNRAACSIQMHQWQRALTDCDNALNLPLQPALKIKVLWRKAVCLRMLGNDKSQWEATVMAGLQLDASNAKLLEEKEYVYVPVVDQMPQAYRSAPGAPAAKPAAPPAAAKPAQAARDFMPALPITYGGLLNLTRSTSPEVPSFCYDHITSSDLKRALSQSGVEPEVLDFFFALAANNPQQKTKNAEYLQVLKQLPRYDMAELMANDQLRSRAMTALQ